MRAEPSVRFWQKVRKLKSGKVTNGERCWEWTAGLNAQGYGLFNAGGGRCVLAHRYSYDQSSDEPAGQKCVLHDCDNPKCVNPAHLFIGTRSDNAADKVRKGRQRRPTGARHPKAKMTPATVRSMRADYASGRCRNLSELARRYGIGHTAVRAIIGRKTWKGADYEPD